MVRVYHSRRTLTFSLYIETTQITYMIFRRISLYYVDQSFRCEGGVFSRSHLTYPYAFLTQGTRKKTLNHSHLKGVREK